MRILFIIVPLVFLGCSSAQLIKETKDGGRVAAYGAKGVAADQAIAKAHAKMAEKCPEGYEIIEEGWQGSGVASYGSGLSMEHQEKYFDFKCTAN